MKKIIITFLIIFTFTIYAQVQIDFYYQDGCSECKKVKESVLPQLPQNSSVNYLDLSNEDNFLKLIATQEKLQIDDNSAVIIVLNNQIYLGGFNEIREKLIPILQKEIPENIEVKPDSNTIQNRANKFTLGATIIAGVIDGVNPCVFSTLIFFMSVLVVSKIKGRRLLFVGISYTLASFLTYFLLGLGTFKVVSALKNLHFIDWIMAMVLIILAIVSLVDAVRFKRSKQNKKVILKLPERVKTLSNSVIKRGLKSPYFILGIFIVGVVVTLLETLCTGQVYLPTLILMNKLQGGRYLWYLLAYNIAFIIPLIVVFIIVYRGVNSQKMLQWSQKNVVWGKVLLATLFILLAGLICFL